jgi:hypothetical protein
MIYRDVLYRSGLADNVGLGHHQAWTGLAFRVTAFRELEPWQRSRFPWALRLTQESEGPAVTEPVHAINTIGPQPYLCKMYEEKRATDWAKKQAGQTSWEDHTKPK